MRKALLIIDRGSKETEVRHELEEIAKIAKEKGNYHYTNYCFLEVVPPFIEEGIAGCLDENVDFITVMPYFLYPGMKLKDSVKQSAILAKRFGLKLVITKPLSYSDMLSSIIVNRVAKLKRDKKISYENSDCDVLVIGHGSSDKRAREAFIFTVDKIKQIYKNVKFCFLELDLPNIEQGLSSIIQTDPKVILIMPYFLHKGIHIKSDVVNEIKQVLKKYPFSNVHISDHIGVDEKMVELVLERAKESENRRSD